MKAGKLHRGWIVASVLLLAAGGFLAIQQPWKGAAVANDASPLSSQSVEILLITIDTLRADALGFAGNRRAETPTLDRLARGGLAFTNAHAHNVVTLPSHANILTGLYPYQHGIRDNSGFRLDLKIPTLATYLKAKGYATGAFVGAFPLDSRFGLERGFDEYDDRYPKGKAGLDFEMPERPASEVIAAARKWYEANRGRRRFLWVHLFDPHAPYRPPSPVAGRFRGNPYLGEVAATDAALAPLLDPFLSGKAPPTLIVLTADHGEALGDHEEETHGLFAYEATLRVPLIVWFPGSVTAGVRADSVRHVDIAPTVLAAAGIGKPAEMPGDSLLSMRAKESKDVSYFESFSASYNRGWAPLRGIVAGGYKFIDLPVPELYDLQADPRETRNLISEKRDMVRKLRREIPAESEISAYARGEPGREEVAQLKSLGYLAGSAPIKKTYAAEDDPKSLIPVDRDIHRCVDLYQRGDLEGATAVARRLVADRPTMTLAYENLGFLLRQKEDVSGALEVYRAAVQKGVASEGLKMHFALTLSESGRAPEAVLLLQPLSGSRDPDTLNALGIALADSGRGSEALQVFQRVLGLDPENVEAYENMGIVHIRREDFPRARDLFGRALAIDESLPRAWNGLGVAQARLGEEREAMSSWAKAAALDPKLYDALFNLGLTAAKNDRRQEARRALERFVATAPRSRYGSDIEKARGLLRILREKGS